MTTPQPRRHRLLRLAPLLASLVACAVVSGEAMAGCSHPAGATTLRRATTALQVVELAETGDATTWAPPGRPCNGPRCQSKAPSADAPIPAPLPDRDDGCLAGLTLAPASRDPVAVAWADPFLSPILTALALERPPRGV
ncbi:hypothetical protein [Paludisphaera mucosa]|uniref:Secreted protein n=1 Tax=Paludisphaera mucosa TaxID=3030827 RepID=A0ABT6F949_9BACT|nr:hypothetical protein [Paludisphaera mucosa]MDG3004118.1 hypothetical protein [Paludisphaera mucosa]